jgi:Ca-activated chloride channel family protein
MRIEVNGDGRCSTLKLVFTNQYANILLIANSLALLFYLGAKKKKRQRAMKFGNYKTLQKVAGKNFLKSSNIMLVTRMLALTALVIGISSPALEYEELSTGTDYMIAVDTSPNMLTADVEPTRLQAAKDTGAQFVQQLSNRTQVGVISFAGEVNDEKSLSSNKPATVAAIQDIEPGDTAGTALADAIYASSTKLIDSNESRTILVLSDGNNNVGGSLNESVDYANSHNIKINTIGVGERRNASDSSGYEIVNGVNASRADYPNMNTENLAYVANKTGGKFITVSNTDNLEEVFLEFEQNTVQEDISIYFIFAALILMLIEWVLGTTRFSILP